MARLLEAPPGGRRRGVQAGKPDRMLHYASLNVSDLVRSGAFYDAILAPLGWRRHDAGNDAVGWGLNKPEFYIVRDEGQRPGFGLISFPAKSIPAVKASYESAMANGGESVAEPGSPPLHGSGNYSTRLRDPDGYLVELVVAP
jgi:catechol 2,3-dioxygenase-like lactoylglutathione lyase family enzyme